MIDQDKTGLTTVTINGGSITNCSSLYQSSAVYLSDSTFTMNGGTISNNKLNGDVDGISVLVYTNNNKYYSTAVIANGGTIDGKVNFSGRDEAISFNRNNQNGTATVFNSDVSFLNDDSGSMVNAGIFYGNLTGNVSNTKYTVKFFENDTDTEPFATALVVGDKTKLVPPDNARKRGPYSCVVHGKTAVNMTLTALLRTTSHFMQSLYQWAVAKQEQKQKLAQTQAFRYGLIFCFPS